MLLTKQCGACRKRFPLPAFGNNKAKKDGKYGYCNLCKRKANEQRRVINRQRALSAKLTTAYCSCHGYKITEQNHRQFEWDHINPHTKCYTIGKMLSYSDTAFYAELKKCRLVCVDWHRQHTRQQHLDGVYKIAEQQELHFAPFEEVYQLSLFEDF